MYMIGKTPTNISVMFERIHKDWHTDERLRCIRSLGCQWSRPVLHTPGEPQKWTCADCLIVPMFNSFTRQLKRPRSIVVSSRTMTSICPDTSYWNCGRRPPIALATSADD